MSVLTFTGARLAQVEHLDQMLTFATTPTARTPEGRAQLVEGVYSGGVTRLTSTGADSEMIVYQVPVIIRADYERLRSWRGTLVLYRDDLGNADYGVLVHVTGGQTSRSQVEGTAASYANVRFTIRRTSHDAGSFTASVV